jgi:hypothetical protein
MGSSIVIYQVNMYGAQPTFFNSADNANAKSEAQTLQVQRQQELLGQESYRFSICATFADGTDVTWRAVQDTDPEETVCQVFDTLTGQYTECPNKTAALALNEQKKQAFLESVGMDRVIELAEMPVLPE